MRDMLRLSPADDLMLTAQTVAAKGWYIYEVCECAQATA
jgi:hypothetical protein